MLKLKFIIGIVTEDQSTEKKLDIRRLAPSKAGIFKYIVQGPNLID